MKYTKKVMDHFANPRNVGELENYNAVGEVGNIGIGQVLNGVTVTILNEIHISDGVPFIAVGAATLYKSADSAIGQLNDGAFVSSGVGGKSIPIAGSTVNQADAAGVAIDGESQLAIGGDDAGTGAQNAPELTAGLHIHKLGIRPILTVGRGLHCNVAGGVCVEIGVGREELIDRLQKEV